MTTVTIEFLGHPCQVTGTVYHDPGEPPTRDCPGAIEELYFETIARVQLGDLEIDYQHILNQCQAELFWEKLDAALQREKR